MKLNLRWRKDEKEKMFHLILFNVNKKLNRYGCNKSMSQEIPRIFFRYFIHILILIHSFILRYLLFVYSYLYLYWKFFLVLILIIFLYPEKHQTKPLNYERLRNQELKIISEVYFSLIDRDKFMWKIIKDID